MAWILQGTYTGGDLHGKPKYHKADTDIGPMSTLDRDEAFLFSSRQEACDSSGFRHWSSNLRPVEVAAGAAKAPNQ